jgi:hypothetical protein
MSFGDETMRVVAWIVVLLMALVGRAWGAGPVMEGAEGQRGYDDLGACYSGKDPIDVERNWADLESPNADVRAAAGRYLLALCRQSWDDEISGRTTFDTRPPGFGERPGTVARQIRQSLAGALPEHAVVEALPAIEWLLKNDVLAKTRLDAMEALGEIRSPDADRVLVELVSKPYPLGRVVARALEQVEKRDLRTARAALPVLAVHYRSDVRNSARTLAAKWGVNELPEFKPVEALAPFDTVLRDVAAMVYTPIPQDARFVKTRRIYLSATGEQGPVGESWGWLLREDAERHYLLDQFGEQVYAPRSLTTIMPATLGQWGDWLLKLRADEHQDSAAADKIRSLSYYDSLSGQFEPEALRLPEILAAAWAYARGDRAMAAAIMLPRLEALADERWFREIARDMLGHMYDQDMLQMFVDTRDYPEAMNYARHLASPLFADFEYRPRAEKLLRELPERMKTDFVTLTLPTPAEWKRLRGGMARAEQIRYLADRLRLLNVRQPGWPADMDFNQPQRSAPLGDGNYPHVDYTRGEARINPYGELLAMRLAPSELPTLLPYLGDEDFILGFHFWRPWASTWHLFSVNELVAGLANEATGKRFVELDDYNSLPADIRAGYISEAQQRAQATHPRWVQALCDMDALGISDRKIQVNWMISASMLAVGLLWHGRLCKPRRLAALGLICLGLEALVTFWYPAFFAHRSLTWMDRVPLGVAAGAVILTRVRKGTRSKSRWLGAMVVAVIAGYCCDGLLVADWIVDGTALTVFAWVAMALTAVTGWVNRLLAGVALLGGGFGFAFPDYALFSLHHYGVFTRPDPQWVLEWPYLTAAAALGVACIALLLVNLRTQGHPAGAMAEN